MIACWAINSNSPLVSTIKQHHCSVYIHKGKLLMSKGRLTGLDTSALPCLQSRLTKSRTFSYKDWFSPPASQAVLRMLLLPGFLVARLRHHPLGRLTRGNLAPDSLLHIARTMRLPTKNSIETTIVSPMRQVLVWRLSLLERRVGLEPTTSDLEGPRSAN